LFLVGLSGGGVEEFRHSPGRGRDEGY
jgi:hypothetical protein